MPLPVARSYYDAVGASTVGLDCKDPSKAVQAAKEECDLNVIVKKYLRTGELPKARQGAYIDLVALPDYQVALNTVIAAEEAFYSLPADVRREFDNDPTKLVSFVGDNKNYARALELGLIPPKARAGGPASAPGQGAPGGVPASSQPLVEGSGQ